MTGFLSANKKWWNQATSVHLRSKLYDVPAFRNGQTSLESIELNEVDQVFGKSLLHLMCHFGMDTLSFARMGAKTTGVDFSEESVKIAKKLSKEIDVASQFVCSDIYKLPEILDTKFDIIFTSYGVLLWLSNLKKWAKIIRHFLKDGGIFYIVETHPFTNILSHDFEIFYNYFKKGPYKDDSQGSYTDWSAPLTGVTYDWSYTLGDVINSLIQQGLKIEFIHEFPFTVYEQFPGFMKQNDKGQYVLKNREIQIPLLFSLKATK